MNTVSVAIERIAEPDRQLSAAAALVDPHLMYTLAEAAEVRTHEQFYKWLQNGVQRYIPHHTLLNAWGDFADGALSFDIASSLPGVTTRALAADADLVKAMIRLHDRLDAVGGDWCVVRGLHSLVSVCGADLDVAFYRRFSKNTRTLLVHRTRCLRGAYDCVYAFALRDLRFSFDPLALEVLLPHLDLALRKIDSLPGARDKDSLALMASLASLSEREQQVMHWVSQGKSNEEVGSILDISHNTVKNHLKRVYGKLGVSSRSQAVRVYTTAGQMQQRG